MIQTHFLSLLKQSQFQILLLLVLPKILSNMAFTAVLVFTLTIRFSLPISTEKFTVMLNTVHSKFLLNYSILFLQFHFNLPSNLHGIHALGNQDLSFIPHGKLQYNSIQFINQGYFHPLW